MTAAAPPPAPKSEVAKTTPMPPPAISLGARGVELKSFEELFRMATAAVRAGFAPEGVKTPEQALVAMEYGMELGFTPMRALTVCPVINGRPSIMGDAALALLRRDGLIARDEPMVAYEGDGDARTCTVSFPSSHPGIAASFSVQDAKKAGLWGKRAWAGYPDWMLMWRATGRVCRVHFSDVLLGLPLAEEARDFPPVRGTSTALALGPGPGNPDALLEAALGPQNVETRGPAFSEEVIEAEVAPQAGQIEEDPVPPGWRRLACEKCGTEDDYPIVGSFGCTADCGAWVDEAGTWTWPKPPPAQPAPQVGSGQTPPPEERLRRDAVPLERAAPARAPRSTRPRSKAAEPEDFDFAPPPEGGKF